MKQATAIAHPNIALVKYWGKRDLPLNLPAVPSLSLTLSKYKTTTSVAPSEVDRLFIGDTQASAAFAARAFRFADQLLPQRPALRVQTQNNFPTGAGLASSASGFAALTLALAASADLDYDVDTLSAWARRGSGSACRSLYGGLVHWPMGRRPDGTDSHGIELLGAQACDDWGLRMVTAVVQEAEKAVGSTQGMQRSAETSPLWTSWVEGGEGDVADAMSAIEQRDLPKLGEIMERSTFKMHGVMHSSTPPLIYWQPLTLQVIHRVHALRNQGIGAWTTMDAGPQVKILCHVEQAQAVAEAIADLCIQVDILGPGEPAWVE